MQVKEGRRTGIDRPKFVKTALQPSNMFSLTHHQVTGSSQALFQGMLNISLSLK